MIQLDQISKSFGGQEVIHDLSLEIPEEKTVVLIGPSGCGKSTLLRLMIGILWPDKGRISLLRKELTSQNIESLRQQVGFVLQDGGLFPHLTAAQNICLMAKYLQRDPAWIQSRLAELCALSRLSLDLLERYPRQLSGGQVQRVALMRALMLDPQVLFLDEPLGALDPLHRVSLQDDMKSIFSELKKTVIMVTHDMGEAASLADLIVIMREGRIVQYDNMATLVTQPADPFVVEFINAQRKPWQHLEDQIR
ncbi:ATP-binding cassette domain-containing protein [bacterium]|nr:ATP-binding cassette domain-containing protein [bacterium]